MSTGVPSTEVLVELTNECRSREEYEAARLEWLERAIGFDASYVGAALPENPQADPVITGVNREQVAHCEAQSDRYWRDRLTLNYAALRAGGAVFDQDVVPAAERDRMPFYREVIDDMGIRAIAVSVLRTRGVTIGCLYLGRVSRGARFGNELERLRTALPALALGKRLFDADPTPLPKGVTYNAPLTPREREVLGQMTSGATNLQIASRLGSSPKTVKNQVASILAKTGAKNRTELVYLATRTQAPLAALQNSRQSVGASRSPKL